ncbi:MAG: C40 family peptidase [Holophagaceae bacterium]|nr:C40 family peptidase [Holophagaceae bacterium]
MENFSFQQSITTAALSWLNTPYHHEARLKGIGVDCGQFPAAVFESLGLIPKLDIEPYPHDWHLHRDEERYLEIVERHFEKVDSPLPGDLALFRFGRAISHGSIVIDWPLIIHAYINARAVVLDDAIANQDLAKRLVGFWRLKG